MSTKHYYAMRTPMGHDCTWGDTRAIYGTVVMFAKKRERDNWVKDNDYNPRTGNTNQTMTLTEHEARVTMLRQHGRALYEAHELHRRSYADYREYAQYCPTATMVNDYNRVLGLVE
jgi:hypothetical protein